ncbi:hypothetical protein Y032_0017g3224 [Ancylostoma ceylanicum]|uniref:Uncharacterized protein n=1 Tax=Ancylostoma ceylanicum TaxID=53326 RepID=A0A016V4P1_9BILA|nr:hypothetical protein Y032_0017g3224 [Ancylostoma ceylanicum]
MQVRGADLGVECDDRLVLASRKLTVQRDAEQSARGISLKICKIHLHLHRRNRQLSEELAVVYQLHSYFKTTIIREEC